MTDDKKVSEIIDVISEMIIKYLEDCRDSQCESEEENLQVA
ncbi:hypothetical protein [Clostridium sp. YIM B02551]|nr:hypothetical protein [Clostridium sp. YIM B02551]